MKDNIGLGDRVKDRLTGFEGIVVGQCQYLTGCDQALIKPDRLKDDGTTIDSQWLDSQRLDVVQAGAFTLDNGDTPGGPQYW